MSGRGGAGNILAQQLQRQQAADDVEAQTQPAESAVSQTSSSTLPSQYSYSGRGGAGNLYSPRELATAGIFTDTEVVGQRTATTQPGKVTIEQGTSPVVRKVGRGGAGNYEYGTAQGQVNATTEAADDQKKGLEIQSTVEQDVNEQLAVPAKARIPDAGVYRG